MNKSKFFGLAALVAVLVMVSSPAVMACGSKDGAVKMGSTEKATATMVSSEADRNESDIYPATSEKASAANTETKTWSTCGSREKTMKAYKKTEGEIGTTAASTTKKGEYGNVFRATLAVKGMTCGGCEKSVKTALESYEGVTEVVAVDHNTGTAVVNYNSEKIEPEKLAEVVGQLGYEAKLTESKSAAQQ
jgi:copper chaperone CopZ